MFFLELARHEVVDGRLLGSLLWHQSSLRIFLVDQQVYLRLIHSFIHVNMGCIQLLDVDDVKLLAFRQVIKPDLLLRTHEKLNEI